MSRDGKPKVVVIGAGFGGLAVTKALAGRAVDITVIDRRNYHLFQPLLYQVATAALSPADIAWPIRGILRRQKNARVVMRRVTDVDCERRVVRLGDAEIPYDYLVIATGARHDYFGSDAWAPHAPGLKKIDDALEIRRRILTAFERAEVEPDPERRRQLLTFAIVGAGPTGVELAGALAELARKALAADFRNIDPKLARIVLVEAGPNVLSTFHADLSAAARNALEEMGVEVMTGAPVVSCAPEGIRIGESEVPAATIIWAAGVLASPAAQWLDVQCDAARRVIVNPDLSVPEHPEVFVIGDAAHIADSAKALVPGVAPAAKQAGRYVANVIARRLAGQPAPAPFRYRNPGDLATIGRKCAVIDFGLLRLTGLPAWLLWSAAHVYFLIGARHRLMVAINWIWSYVTFERGARLITGADS